MNLVYVYHKSILYGTKILSHHGFIYHQAEQCSVGFYSVNNDQQKMAVIVCDWQRLENVHLYLNGRSIDCDEHVQAKVVKYKNTKDTADQSAICKRWKCLSLSHWMILFTFERLALSATVHRDVIDFHILSAALYTATIKIKGLLPKVCEK